MVDDHLWARSGAGPYQSEAANQRASHAEAADHLAATNVFRIYRILPAFLRSKLFD